MSTIYEFQASDSGSVVLGALNDNFEALNTDKIEATQAVALTNKTIDGDLNTLQDIHYDSIKSTHRTGLDAKLVTGTAGLNNEVMFWDNNGDAISNGVTLVGSSPGISAASTNAQLPTALAVYNAIQDALATKQVFVPCIKDADTSPYTPAVLSPWAFAQIDSGESAYFSFHCPADFHTLTSVELVMIPDATETLTMTTLTVNIAASGELYNNHAVTASNQTLGVTVDRITKWRLDTMTGSPFASMAANDMVGILVVSGTTLMRVIGILMKYS